MITKGKAQGLKRVRAVAEPSHEELAAAGMVVCAGPFRISERAAMREQILTLLKDKVAIRTQHRYSHGSGHQYFIYREKPSQPMETSKDRQKRLTKTPDALKTTRLHGSAAMRETLQRNAHRNGIRRAREYGKRGGA